MKEFRLDNMPKIKPGFRTPEGYFDTLDERLMQQLPGREVKVVPLYRRKPVWMSAVAAVFIIALSLTLVFRTAATSPAQPDAAAIEEYLVYDAGISSYELLENLDEKDISELEQSIAISDEAIEDYLYTQDNTTY